MKSKTCRCFPFLVSQIFSFMLVTQPLSMIFCKQNRSCKNLQRNQIITKKYTIPKTSSNDQISAVFEDIAEALNNPKLGEGFLNCNKEKDVQWNEKNHYPSSKGQIRYRYRKHCSCKGGKPICEQKLMFDQNTAKNIRVLEKIC